MRRSRSRRRSMQPSDSHKCLCTEDVFLPIDIDDFNERETLQPDRETHVIRTTKPKERIWFPHQHLFLSLAVSCTVLLVVGLLHSKPLHRPTSVVTPTANKSNTSTDKPKLLVSSPSCQIPYYSPFGRSVKQLLKPVEPVICSRVSPLTIVERIFETEDSYILRIQQELIPLYIPFGHQLSCCYSNIMRLTAKAGKKDGNDADDLFNVSKCLHFKKEMMLSSEEEFILVKCKSHRNGNKNETKNVYMNVHSAVPIKKNVRNKIRKRKQPDDDDKLNVLILSYSAISQLNLLRNMPKTVTFLKKSGFINLRGYTKVEADTFPNMFALLTGLEFIRNKTHCWNCSEDKGNRIKVILDEYPFIWKEFQTQGYVTGYFDDARTMEAGTYHYTFVHQPTEYYLRPYILAAEKHLSLKYRFSRHVCLGRTSCTDHVFHYVMEFLSTFKHYKHFSVALLDNFSRNDINLPANMDKRTLQFFEELGLYNIYNSTLVLFTSGEGMRYGKIRNTIQGWYEYRAPFLYIYLPDWYKNKYPEKFQRLENNTNKLASTYDLHSTLRDVLYIGHKFDNQNATFSLACPKCKSVISEDLGDRSCEDAGIPHEFCPCSQYEEMSIKDEVVEESARHAVSVIMQKLKNETKPQQCAELKMSRIMNAQKQTDVQEHELSTYVVTFETNPGGAHFQVLLKHDFQKNTFYTINVDRTNYSGNQGYCVDNEELQLFCYCI